MRAYSFFGTTRRRSPRTGAVGVETAKSESTKAWRVSKTKNGRTEAGAVLPQAGLRCAANGCRASGCRSSRMPGVAASLRFAALVTVLVVAFSIGCGSYDNLTRVTISLPRAGECGTCHVEIYDEWRRSSHATAYTNPRFREATDDYSFPECLGCHAPEPSLTLETPGAREVFREEGVTCVSCHLEEAKLWGPFETSGLVVPHPVGADPERYSDSRFCGRCHEGTLQEWQASESDGKRSCQECHMPAVTRKLTQATDTISSLIVAFEDDHVVKRHTFTRVPRDTEPVLITCELVTSGGRTLLRLCNNLPHSLPPGDFGVRIVTVEALALSGGAAGPDASDPEPQLLGRWELVREIGTHAPPGASREWPLSLLSGCRAVLVRVFREGRDGAGKELLLKCEVLTP